MKKTRSINIIIAGGCGFWAERNHFKALLDLREKNVTVKVVAIIDILDPYKQTNRPNLQRILKDKPIWINPKGRSEYRLMSELTSLHKKFLINAIVVSTTPSAHFFYCAWALKNNINVLCDKPLVVTPNASSNLNNALQIQSKFNRLEKLYEAAYQKNNNYIFCTPLRRRALTPFVRLANELEEVYKKTDEGIRYMNVITNGGLHRYPIEFTKGGAHGYIDGIGALAHSSYHYIDVIAWYLQIAIGKTKKIRVSMPYVFRVKDYLKIKGYSKLKELIEDDSDSINDQVKLPNNILACELDFIFHLELLDANDLPVGLVSYTSNHTTYTPRLAKYDLRAVDPAHNSKGGRMSQLFMDIHQGAIQNWQLIKNDVVFHKNNIIITRRRHSKLGIEFIRKNYNDAYEKDTVSPKDLFTSFILRAGGYKIPNTHMRYLSRLEGQKLTARLFSLFYEIIAHEYENRRSNKHSPSVASMIDLRNL